MGENTLDQLKSLIVKYTVVTHIPDIEGYRRIPEGKRGQCIFRGCTEPIAWEDAQGGNSLCDGHYRVMRSWIEEARRGLLPGRLTSRLFSGGRDDAGQK